jgi:hypothetical protein
VTALVIHNHDHTDQDCSCRPPCPFCGGILVDDGDLLVCVPCATVADARLIVATVIL